MIAAVIIALVVVVFAVPIWMDHQAGRRHQKIRSSSEMLAERRELRRNLRASSPERGIPITGPDEWSAPQRDPYTGYDGD